jgi:hypothetical protein
MYIFIHQLTVAIGFVNIFIKWWQVHQREQQRANFALDQI